MAELSRRIEIEAEKKAIAEKKQQQAEKEQRLLAAASAESSAAIRNFFVNPLTIFMLIFGVIATICIIAGQQKEESAGPAPIRDRLDYEGGLARVGDELKSDYAWKAPIHLECDLNSDSLSDCIADDRSSHEHRILFLVGLPPKGVYLKVIAINTAVRVSDITVLPDSTKPINTIKMIRRRGVEIDSSIFVWKKNHYENALDSTRMLEISSIPESMTVFRMLQEAEKQATLPPPVIPPDDRLAASEPTDDTDDISFTNETSLEALEDSITVEKILSLPFVITSSDVQQCYLNDDSLLDYVVSDTSQAGTQRCLFLLKIPGSLDKLMVISMNKLLKPNDVHVLQTKQGHMYDLRLVFRQASRVDSIVVRWSGQGYRPDRKSPQWNGVGNALYYLSIIPPISDHSADNDESCGQ